MTEFPIAVPSRGSKLLGKTVSTKLDRQTLEQIILEGFFATTCIEDLPQKTRRAGLQEFGLPYAADPVISKHLARFLTRSLENVQSSQTLRSLISAEFSFELVPETIRFPVQRRGFQSRSDPALRRRPISGLRGSKADLFVQFPVAYTSRIWRWRRGRCSSDAIGSREKGYASRRAHRDLITLDLSNRCPRRPALVRR